VVFSLLCVWLAVKKHVLNWPAGLIGVSAYFVLFYREKLFADMLLQVVFFVQGIYGWYNWQRNKANAHELEITYLHTSQRVAYLAGIAAVAVLWGWSLSRYTEASTPWVDALAATISLAANWLMAKRKTDNWILWIVVDAIYIGLFWYKALYLSSAIYLVFLVLATKGLIEWNKKSVIKKDSY